MFFILTSCTGCIICLGSEAKYQIHKFRYTYKYLCYKTNISEFYTYWQKNYFFSYDKGMFRNVLPTKHLFDYSLTFKSFCYFALLEYSTTGVSRVWYQTLDPLSFVFDHDDDDLWSDSLTASGCSTVSLVKEPCVQPSG